MDKTSKIIIIIFILVVGYGIATYLSLDLFGIRLSLEDSRTDYNWWVWCGSMIVVILLCVKIWVGSKKG